jgi:hypothetical protein
MCQGTVDPFSHRNIVSQRVFPKAQNTPPEAMELP